MVREQVGSHQQDQKQEQEQHWRRRSYNYAHAPGILRRISLQHGRGANKPYNLGAKPVTAMPIEDKERLACIFKKLDREGDGRIDIQDLSAALHGLSSVHAEKFLQQAKLGLDVGIAEFLHYVREHEKNLVLRFSHLDKNRDGKVELHELINAFKDLGLDIGLAEAKTLLTRMDKDGSLSISFDEWHDIVLQPPFTGIQDLMIYWRRHANHLDLGEDLTVPDDFTPDELQTGLWWRHLVAGGIAGAVSRTCTAPLDRIKVYLQVQTQRISISECLQLMLKEGGTWSMWRGNGINVLKICPETALKFTAYEQMKQLIRRGHDTSRQMSIAERFYAGAAAGGISQTIIYPMEVLKTRLALSKTGQYAGIADAAIKIFRQEGLRNFYRGYIPNILGILPHAGIDLAVYETLKRRYIANYSQGNSDEQPSFVVLLACGSTSSALGQICSYPLALVRTRLQALAADTIANEKRSRTKRPNPLTMRGQLSQIVRQEGLAGLYRGIMPNFLKVLPAVSISYVVYEYSSQVLGIKMS